MAADPVLHVRDDPAASRFEIRDGNELAGFVTYRRKGRRVDLVHTEVGDAFGGRGVGSALAAGSLDALAAEGAEVVPSCEFIRTYIERHPAYLGLVPAEAREALGLQDG